MSIRPIKRLVMAKPTLEGVWFWHQNTRMSLGFRANLEYIRSYSGSKELPIFEKLFLGGEYTVRGFDIRSIGPRGDERVWRAAGRGDVEAQL